MEIPQLPVQILLEASDLVGLQMALRNRRKAFRPLLNGLLRLSGIDVEQSEEFSKLKASARRSARTFKGLEQVIERFFAGPKDLEKIDPDRMKQEGEELRRFKLQLIQVISDFDALVLTAARKIKRRKS
jgi:hypothetical protein